MGFRILYIANYYLEDVTAQRHSEPYISQAAQNKSNYIIDMLRSGGNDVTVWSNAWTSSSSFHYYKGFQSKIDGRVYYSDIFGAPFLNFCTCRRSCMSFLKQQQKKKPFDFIVFYNMRPENVPVALYGKKTYHIPVILQYEDGLTRDANVGGFKRRFYRRLEDRALPELDGAFLVTSRMKVNCPGIVIRGAMRDHISESPAGHRNMPKFLFASSLDRQRGLEVVLEALQYTNEAFELVITGRGELEPLVRDCRDSRVRYMGYLKYEEYQKALSETDVCVNAQLAKGEFGNVSFPSKLYEYLSYGKLVISSDVADAGEVLDQIAFIYKEDDPKALAKRIEEVICVLRDPEELSSYRGRIRKFVEENSMERVAQNVNCMLNKIAGRKR